ncbi:MAG: phosphatidylserine decarboxylase, partial [Chthoniobacterales bacterium]
MRLQTLYEARSIFGILLLLTVASWLFSPWLAGVWLILIVYTFAFFRDPDRVAPNESDAVVAAADGVVADIVEVEERDVLKKPMKRVGIFL